MKLIDVLDTKSIELNVKINDKTELIKFMIDLAAKTGKLINKDEVLSQVLKREELMPTGIGKGIALPHAKTNSVKDTVCALVTLSEEIDYGSIDNSKVKLALMLIGKENNVGIHLRLLSRISRLLGNQQIIESFKAAKSPAQIISILKESEE